MKTKQFIIVFVVIITAAIGLGVGLYAPSKIINDVGRVAARFAFDMLCYFVYAFGGYLAIVLAGKALSNEEILSKRHAALLAIGAATCLSAGWFGFNGNLSALKFF